MEDARRNAHSVQSSLAIAARRLDASTPPEWMPGERRWIHGLLKGLLHVPFPLPGESFLVESKTYLPNDPDSPDFSVRLQRPEDDRVPLADVTAAPLVRALQPKRLIELINLLLGERRVILVSSSLETVSAATVAAAALLYPFSWQHTFIPVLPEALLDFACMPMPFLVGVVASSLPALLALPLEDVVLVDLDSGKLKIPQGATVTAPLPASTGGLETKLKAASVAATRGDDVAAAAGAAEGFLSAFMEVFGGYPRYMNYDARGQMSLQREAFVSVGGAPPLAAPPAPPAVTAALNAEGLAGTPPPTKVPKDKVRPALVKWMREFETSQMFEQWVVEREALMASPPASSLGEFEYRITRGGGSTSKSIGSRAVSAIGGAAGGGFGALKSLGRKMAARVGPKDPSPSASTATSPDAAAAEARTSSSSHSRRSPRPLESDLVTGLKTGFTTAGESLKALIGAAVQLVGGEIPPQDPHFELAFEDLHSSWAPSKPQKSRQPPRSVAMDAALFTLVQVDDADGGNGTPSSSSASSAALPLSNQPPPPVASPLISELISPEPVTAVPPTGSGMVSSSLMDDLHGLDMGPPKPIPDLISLMPEPAPIEPIATLAPAPVSSTAPEGWVSFDSGPVPPPIVSSGLSPMPGGQAAHPAAPPPPAKKAMSIDDMVGSIMAEFGNK